MVVVLSTCRRACPIRQTQRFVIHLVCCETLTRRALRHYADLLGTAETCRFTTLTRRCLQACVDLTHCAKRQPRGMRLRLEIYFCHPGTGAIWLAIAR